MFSVSLNTSKTGKSLLDKGARGVRWSVAPGFGQGEGVPFLLPYGGVASGSHFQRGKKKGILRKLRELQGDLWK